MSGPSGSAFVRRYLLLALACCAWWQIVWEVDARVNLFLYVVPLFGFPLLFLIPGVLIAIGVHAFHRHWRRAASAGLACCVTVGFCWWVPHNEYGCPVEVVDEVAVPSSDWVVETFGYGCAFAIEYSKDIRARNTRSGESVVLADGEVLETKLSSTSPRSITIRLDNLTFVDEKARRFGDVEVDFDYQPKDDPQERAIWRQWVKNKTLPDNWAWNCKTFLSHLDLSVFRALNESIAKNEMNNLPVCKRP